MRTAGIGGLDPAVTGLGDPHQKRRDYDLSAGLPLVGLLDNPWYPPYIWDEAHAHNCMEIGVCLTGTGWVNIGRRSWPFRPGTVLIVPRGVAHAQQNEGQPMTHWRYVLVNEEAYVADMPLRRQTEIRMRMQRMPCGVYLEGDEASATIRETIEAMFHRHFLVRTLDDLELDALLRLLMARIFDAPSDLGGGEGEAAEAVSRNAIEPALNLVSERYAQEIRVEDLAASCAMSESYFRKVFARIMGMSPLEYVNRYRINRSIHLLYATDNTVLAIAGMTGFPSIATYNRNFRRYVGVSPAQWRKNAHR